jgi:hypothetical protein
MPSDRNLFSLNTSLAIPTFAIRFEVSRLRRRTPVKPVLLTGTHRLDRSDPPVRLIWSYCTSIFGSLVFALWINKGTQWFFGEPLETP